MARGEPFKSAKRRVGRPQSAAIHTRIALPPDLARGVEAFARDPAANADTPSPTEAIRRIVRAWLLSHGYLDD